MIITEHYRTREDGVALNRTYSDKGMMIEREGARYSEAIDPADAERVYTETDDIAESLMVDGNEFLSMLKEAL